MAKAQSERWTEAIRHRLSQPTTPTATPPQHLTPAMVRAAVQLAELVRRADKARNMPGHWGNRGAHTDSAVALLKRSGRQ